MTRKVRFIAAGAALLALGACADVDHDMKLSAIEAKLNEALRNAATAKVDAATAMLIAEEAGKKTK